MPNTNIPRLRFLKGGSKVAGLIGDLPVLSVPSWQDTRKRFFEKAGTKWRIGAKPKMGINKVRNWPQHRGKIALEIIWR